MTTIDEGCLVDVEQHAAEALGLALQAMEGHARMAEYYGDVARVWSEGLKAPRLARRLRADANILGLMVERFETLRTIVTELAQMPPAPAGMMSGYAWVRGVQVWRVGDGYRLDVNGADLGVDEAAEVVLLGAPEVPEAGGPRGGSERYTARLPRVAMQRAQREGDGGLSGPALRVFGVMQCPHGETCGDVMIATGLGECEVRCAFRDLLRVGWIRQVEPADAPAPESGGGVAR